MIVLLKKNHYNGFQWWLQAQIELSFGRGDNISKTIGFLFASIHMVLKIKLPFLASPKMEYTQFSSEIPITLLKRNHHARPFSETEKKVSVFSNYPRCQNGLEKWTWQDSFTKVFRMLRSTIWFFATSSIHKIRTSIIKIITGLSKILPYVL